MNLLFDLKITLFWCKSCTILMLWVRDGLSAASGSVAATKDALLFCDFCPMLNIVARAVDSARRGLNAIMDIVDIHRVRYYLI